LAPLIDSEGRESYVRTYITDKLARDGLGTAFLTARPGTDVLIFKNILAEKFSEKIGVFDSKQSQILKKIIIALVCKKNAIIFFRRKLGKIAENCDQK
jgi:hypothetical protein